MGKISSRQSANYIGERMVTPQNFNGFIYPLIIIQFKWTL